MKAAVFDYHRPGSLDEAVRLLAGSDAFVKVVAGSQSLGPMLNLRLAQPEVLVDITAIPDLREVRETSDYVEIGACVTHADLEDGRVPDPSNGLLAYAAQRIAHRGVRNRGTIGGSLAHADPAADWVSIFPLLGAEARVCGAGGTRTIAVERLMVSSFVTDLRPDEIVVAIRFPKLDAAACWGYSKFNQKAGEFAHALAGILHDPQRSRFRAVVGAIETAPIVLDEASVLFDGPFAPDLADRLNEGALLALLDAKGVGDVYARRQATVALRRAARQATAR